MAVVMDEDAAWKAIVRGNAPRGMIVAGELFIPNQPALKSLPDDLQADELDVRDCPQLRLLPRGLRCRSLTIQRCPITSLPADLHVSGTLDLSTCPELEALPAGLVVQTLILQNCRKLKGLPADLSVTIRLEVNSCPQVEALPPRLAANILSVVACPAIQALPEELRAFSLDIPFCTEFTTWPRNGQPIMRRLNMRGCTGLRSLPPWLFQVDELDVRDCASLRELPQHLHVRRWLELAGSALQRVPTSSRGIRLHWRGVPISGQAAFYPETLKAQAILKERNAEIRRVMLERMGYERFVAGAQATTLDRDKDAGGSRRLLHVPLAGDEALVCLAVLDPSTGRQYLIRVPPGTQTCRQAAAWIAGFDNPDDYHPVAET